MYSSSCTDLSTDVKSVVGNLKNLGDEIESRKELPLANFSKKDLKMCEKLAETLKEIDHKRIEAHQTLEMYTITASVLRHQLKAFPHKIKAELEDVLLSARKSDVALIQTLQICLSDLIQAGSQIEKRKEVLELHSDVLKPEYTSVTMRYRTQVEEVNSLMTNRAKAQIVLNETDDSLRDAQRKIEGLYADLTELDNEIEAFKVDFQIEKESLHDTLKENLKLYTTFSENNQQLTICLGSIEDEALKTSLLMKQQQQTLQDVTEGILHEVALEKQLYINLQQETDVARHLEDTRILIRNDYKTMRNQFKDKENQLDHQTNKFLHEVEQVEVQVGKLLTKKRSLQKDLKKEQDCKVMHQSSVTSLEKDVTNSKHILQFQSEESSRLKAENHNLELRLLQLQESHEISVHQYKDQIQSLQSSLTEEKRVRKDLEKAYCKIQSQVHSQECDLAQTESLLFESKSETDTQQECMLQKLSLLQCQLCTAKEHAVCLTTEILAASKQLETVMNDLQSDIQEIQMKNSEIHETILDRDEALKNLQLCYDAMESKHKSTTTSYEEEKMVVIAMKNKRCGQMEVIHQLQKQKKDVKLHQYTLRMEIISQRAYTRQNLQNQVARAVDTEHTVSTSQQQLKAVTTENEQIAHLIVDFEQECLYFQNIQVNAANVTEQLTSKLERTQESLKKHWNKDKQVEKETSKYHELLLKKMLLLQNHSSKRTEMTSVALTVFEEQMIIFSQYLKVILNKKHTVIVE